MKYAILTLLILTAVCLVGFLIWCMKKKQQGICPFCVIKQHVKKSKITMNIPREFYDGGNAATPPMGWSSWNTFRNQIDENLILETVKALKETGLAQAGYQYVNLDDCWHSSQRDENGRLQGDLSRFSSGIQSLVKKINDMGLKVGLYTSNGEYTCEDLPASLGFEETDARTFAEWGIEYFKYDFCHNKKIPSAAPLVEKVEIKTGSGITVLTADDAGLSGLARLNKSSELETGKYISFLGHGKGSATFEFENENHEDASVTIIVKKSGEFEKYIVIQVNDDYYEMFIPATKAWSPTGRYQTCVKLKCGQNRIKLFNPVCTRADSAYIQYKRMGEALKNASENKKITYSICEWGRNNPQNWAWNAGNLWRTTRDIIPNWQWINLIYNKTLRLAEFAGPGHWNDPDMLEVGNGKLTFEENKTHFALWCMLAAPLILGNDIRKLLIDGDKKPILDLLKNPDMIAINQDKLGKPCVRYKKTSSFDYLVKELDGGNAAVCVYNKSGKVKRAKVSMDEIKNKVQTPSCFKEVWSGKIYKNSQFELDIQPHGCAVFLGMP